MQRTWTRIAPIAALAIFGLASCVSAQSQTAPSSALVPTFAGVNGDGTSVGFSWWAVKGAMGY